MRKNVLHLIGYWPLHGVAPKVASVEWHTHGPAWRPGRQHEHQQVEAKLLDDDPLGRH